MENRTKYNCTQKRRLRPTEKTDIRHERMPEARTHIHPSGSSKFRMRQQLFLLIVFVIFFVTIEDLFEEVFGQKF